MRWIRCAEVNTNFQEKKKYAQTFIIIGKDLKMKEVSKISLIVGICFTLWLINNALQLKYARFTLDSCLEQANANYTENWDNACRTLKKANNCNLPLFRANEVENSRDKNINRCIEIFKYNK